MVEPSRDRGTMTRQPMSEALEVLNKSPAPQCSAGA